MDTIVPISGIIRALEITIDSKQEARNRAFKTAAEKNAEVHRLDAEMALDRKALEALQAIEEYAAINAGSISYIIT